MEGPLLLQTSPSVPSKVASSFNSYRDIERHSNGRRSVQPSPGPRHNSTPIRSATSPLSDALTPRLASSPRIHLSPDLSGPDSSASKKVNLSETTKAIKPSVPEHRNLPNPIVSSATLASYTSTTSSSTPYQSVRPPPSSIDCHSSLFWCKEKDELLVQARQQGLNWQPIASTYFPSKTPNACRKRHERLMEKRRNADNWDDVNMDKLAKAYNDVREQMWRLLADEIGEQKWQTVEAKCMEKGLKVLQTEGRTASRRDRIVQHHALGAGIGSNFEDISDLHRLSPKREGFKSRPNSDDGFEDSAVGLDAVVTPNLQSPHHVPSFKRSYPRSSMPPHATPSSDLTPLFPPLSRVLSTASSESQVPSQPRSQCSSYPAGLPSFSSTIGMPDVGSVFSHVLSNLTASENGRFHEEGPVSKMHPSEDHSDILISSEQRSANVNRTILGQIPKDESSPMRFVAHKEILEDHSELKFDSEESPNEAVSTVPRVARPENKEFEYDFQLCGVKNKSTTPHEDSNSHEQAHHERSLGSAVAASNISNAHASEEVDSESACSIDDRSPLSDNGVSRLELLHGKHMIVADIMRDVYGLFDGQWNGYTKACTGYGNEHPDRPISSSNNQGSRSSSALKRKSDDLDPEQPDDGKGGKRRSNGARQADQSLQGHLFACPFNKFDPRRFCVTAATGQKYRTCWRPGFDSIARLRQHLRRKHKAPVQCPRCWITLSTVQELSHHTNEEQRCHQRAPKEEGINQDKMELIESHWGARWEQIFEIIFPGAPVPHPYIDDATPQFEESHDSSPAAQSFREFNDYSRVALPMAVEASLRAIVHSKMAPIEEEVKVLVVDIVRRCQSTVAQDFQQAQRLKNVLAQSSDATPTGAQSTIWADQLPDPVKTFTPDAAPDICANAITHYQEPPFSDFDTGLTPPSYSRPTHQKQASDSGYGTNNSPCTCQCHVGVSSSSSSIDTPDCDFCAAKHAEPELTAYKDFYNLFET